MTDPAAMEFARRLPVRRGDIGRLIRSWRLPGPPMRVEKSGPVTLVYDPEVDSATIENFRRLEFGDADMIKGGDAARAYAWRGMVLKEYRMGGPKAAIRRRLRRSRAWRSWFMGRALAELGVPTPLPLALYSAPGEEWLLQRLAPGIQFSRMLEQEHPDAPLAERAILSWIEALGRAGFIHGDCKAQNFIWDPESGIRIIDLDSMIWTPRPGRAARLLSRERLRLQANRRQFRPARES